MRFFLILLIGLLTTGLLTTGAARAQPPEPDVEPWLEACEAGEAFACNYASGVLQRRDSGYWLTDEAVELQLRGCALGSDRSCWLFERINTPNPYIGPRYDRDVYLPVALSGCRNGSNMACWQAAGFFEEGNAGEREQARELWRQSCEGGFSDGCARLADILDGMGRDSLQASQAACFGNFPGRMRKQDDCTVACEAGSGRACFELALMFERGRDGAQTMRRDARQAQRRFVQACELGQVEACER